MDDYELLLELDRTPNSSVSAQLCMSLPKYRGHTAERHGLYCGMSDKLEASCWCCVAEDGDRTRNRTVNPHIAQSPLRLCHVVTWRTSGVCVQP